MANTFPILAVIDARGRDISLINWCSPRCSEFRLGERPGVILPAAQRHELALFAPKGIPSGGMFAAKEVVVNHNDVGRYGTVSSPTGTSRHESSRNGRREKKYPRQGSNL